MSPTKYPSRSRVFHSGVLRFGRLSRSRRNYACTVVRFVESFSTSRTACHSPKTARTRIQPQARCVSRMSPAGCGAAPGKRDSPAHPHSAYPPARVHRTIPASVRHAPCRVCSSCSLCLSESGCAAEYRCRARTSSISACSPRNHDYAGGWRSHGWITTSQHAARESPFNCKSKISITQ